MNPHDVLLDRIDSLRELAEMPRPDGDKANDLLTDIRWRFAACGATHCLRPAQEGVSVGTFDEARRLYGR